MCDIYRHHHFIKYWLTPSHQTSSGRHHRGQGQGQGQGEGDNQERINNAIKYEAGIPSSESQASEPNLVINR
jgi:hypothetical protein